MNGGDIGVDVNVELAEQQGAAWPWIPMLASDAWIRALEFTQAQVEAGIEPFTEHQFGPEFVARRFATWLDGTWVYGALVASGADMSQVGLVAAFPVPAADVPTATMAGGWTLAIPKTSEQPEIAWEFLKAMLDQSTLGAVQARFGYLPTQASFARDLEGDFQAFWNQGDSDRWSALQELAPHAYGRPSFPSWPQVSAAVTDMVQGVMFDKQEPLASAQAGQRTALVDVLGWPEGTTVELHDDAADGSCADPDLDRAVAAVTPIQQQTDGNGNSLICSHVVLP